MNPPVHLSCNVPNVSAFEVKGMFFQLAILHIFVQYTCIALLFQSYAQWITSGAIALMMKMRNAYRRRHDATESSIAMTAQTRLDAPATGRRGR